MGKILKIKKYPDKILREGSRAVEKIAETETKLFEDMFSTMRNSSGIGLAAPQVGINQKLIVADIDGQLLKLANPEVIKAEGKDKMEEGCLSVPGVLVNIERAYEVVVKGLNENGELVEIKARGLLARILLHEIDHLNGKLIIDYMNFFKKVRFKICGRNK
ncbi:MAG: peptide deformylase [Candidatus Omnitrophica bacterium]|nr:peptide deformylase [Candidatus Omnitrophota bacterium]MBU3934342.1 peptide deformylase [Candidatus Omnitrophota bacterium]MBU4140446.1 peptide deformylase [Candidatus Omnitrophota bacterium]